MTTTYLYNGLGRTASWSDPNNWGGFGSPGAADTAVIESGLPGPVTGIISVNNVMLLGRQSITFSGVLITAGVGSCAGLMVCTGASATFTPGSVLNDANGSLVVGVNSIGTVTAQASTVLTTGQTVLGANVGGVGALTFDRSTWSNQGSAIVGMGGAGTLTLADGAHGAIGGSIAAGQLAHGHGVISVTSQASLNVAGAIQLGSDQSGAGSGTLNIGLGSTVVAGHGTAIMPGSTVAMAGGRLTSSVMVSAGGSAAGVGTLATSQGGAIVDNGTISASGGTLTLIGSVLGPGTIEIEGNSTIELSGLALPAIRFNGGDATLQLDQNSDVLSSITNFTNNDSIIVQKATKLAWNEANGMLRVSDGSNVIDVLHLGGIPVGETFAIRQSSLGGVITMHDPTAALPAPLTHA